MGAPRYIVNRETGNKVENKVTSVNLTKEQYDFVKRNKINLSETLRGIIDRWIAESETKDTDLV